jgi:cobalt-zinc-cadmium efflux system outer membrane protein
LSTGTSPVIRQAEADITAARGHAIQEGTHPNPVIGYEGDTVGSSQNPNYQGAYFNQWVKTAGKLQLAQAAAMIDVRNGVLALRKARISLITQVQARYYAVLVAEETVRINEALARFTDEAYRIQIEQLRGGEAAAYEPMQLRVLALQARTALIQARNRYFSAWNQLASVVNAPNLPPTQLAGNPNLMIPTLRFDLLRTIVWERHPDILAARNSTEQARINLRFAEVTPIPDISLYSALQKDYTVGSPGASFNIQVGIPVPIFDRNVGGIMQAQGQLIRAEQENARVRNDLTATLADAYERYENNRAILEYYRVSILPDQARAYRGTYARHQQQPDRVGFADVVVAQQTYATAIANFTTALGAQWAAVTDLLNTVQLEDLIDLQRLMDDFSRMPSPPEIVPPPDPSAPKDHAAGGGR